MPYAAKVILHAPPWDAPELDGFVDTCVRDGVQLICVIGPDCERVHDTIDELIAHKDYPYILTSWHTSETVEAVREFAKSITLNGRRGEAAQEVMLSSG